MVCNCGNINVLHCHCCQQNFAVKLIGLSSCIQATYHSLYVTRTDIQSFGRLVLDIFVGKCQKEFQVCIFVLFIISLSF